MCCRQGSRMPALMPGLPIWSSTKRTSGHCSHHLDRRSADDGGRCRCRRTRSCAASSFSPSMKSGRMQKSGSGWVWISRRTPRRILCRRSWSSSRLDRLPLSERQRRDHAGQRRLGLATAPATHAASSRCCGKSTSTSTKTNVSILTGAAALKRSAGSACRFSEGAPASRHSRTASDQQMHMAVDDRKIRQWTVPHNFKPLTVHVVLQPSGDVETQEEPNLEVRNASSAS